MNSVN